MRRESDDGDQQPVDEAEQSGDPDSTSDCQRNRHAQLRREFGHDDAAERHHHSAGEIDTGGEDHERLTDRYHAYHHHLLQDE